jgi:secreted trypsin-like serine protease
MITRRKTILSGIAMLFMVACGPAPKGDRTALESAETSTAGIIGGKEVAANEPPAQTSVILYDPAAKAICTGSLLGNNIVLTAAHCLGKDPSKILVIFAINISKTTIEMARPVVGAIANTLWRTNRQKPKDTADIALIKYQGTTPPGYKAATILPNVSPLKNNAAILLAGYGISDSTKKTGSGVLRQTVTTISNNVFSSTEILLEQRQGRGACHGDSGGPAYIVANGTYYLWGITSRGNQDTKDQCNAFSVYTNLLAHLKWIQDNARVLLAKNIFDFTQEERTFGRGEML